MEVPVTLLLFVASLSMHFFPGGGQADQSAEWHELWRLPPVLCE